jgi:hypothetical protein
MKAASRPSIHPLSLWERGRGEGARYLLSALLKLSAALTLTLSQRERELALDLSVYA